MSDVDLTRWSRVQHADGSVVLTPPAPHPAFARDRRATLRVRHGVRPIATLDAVCRALHPHIDRADATERVVTDSGDHGAFRALRVIAGDHALHCGVGVIVGDDTMVVVDGLARSPNILALVRDVLEHFVWTAAYDRIRMIPYRTPPGWFGVRRSLATLWLAPGAPRDAAVITVCDAVPRGPAEHTHALLWPLAAPKGATWSAIDGAVPGKLATWTVDGRLAAVVHLADARWSVRAALEAGTEQHVLALRDLVRSIELPPSPPNRVAPGRDLYTWMAT